LGGEQAGGLVASVPPWARLCSPEPHHCVVAYGTMTNGEPTVAYRRLGGGHGARLIMPSESMSSQAKSSTTARTVSAGSTPIGIDSQSELQ
jgi:hypothetical protein